MKSEKKLEVLAPAGSYESMKAAVAAGADAVYMGGTRFGARAYADNPQEETLLEAIDYVHFHGRKLYMTVNTLFKEKEMGELYDYLLPCYRQGLDAVIVQDLGVMAFIRRHFPGLDIHASTQMTITGAEGARLLKELGAMRVVTARELSLEEIARIHRQVDVEIESFVHGALCYCYSGQCLMSSLIGGRSGNRGRCAQPCRLPYEARRRDGSELQILNHKKEQYCLSLKDLCTLDLIPELAEAGIYSLKIEGRMKSPRYTAGVVSLYRKYTDLYLEKGRQGFRVDPEDRKIFLELFDRGGLTDGYYKQHNGRDMVVLKEKPAFREGNQQLFQRLDDTYVNASLKEPVRGRVILEEGQAMELELELLDQKGRERASARVQGQTPQRAQNQPLSRERILKQMEKMGNTPFCVADLTAEVKGELFVPMQALNELRRDGLKALEEKLLGQYRRSEPVQAEESGLGTEAPTVPWQLWALAEEENQLPILLESAGISGIYLESGSFTPENWGRLVLACRQAGKKCVLALPYIYRTHGRRYFEKWNRQLWEAGFDGLLVRNMEELSWLREEKCPLPLITDPGVYCWNRESAGQLAALGISRIGLPWELNSRELESPALACRESGRDSELVVYGRIPMMISAQCVHRTLEGCDHRPGLLELKDRTGALLPVRNCCPFCYNLIYNPAPLSLLGREQEAKRLSPTVVRLNFTTEKPEEVRRIASAFSTVFLEGGQAEQPMKDFTRGHFKRGVE